MAFQKTKGRGVFVKPVGTPDLSGFRAVAKSYEDVARVATGIGLDMRKREYNDLVRQAEIDGKTAGAVFDKQGNLVPLSNFDYGKASQAFNKTDQKGIIAAYKKAALQTYVSAASNDIMRQADAALLASPNDPNGVRGALDGYLEGARDDLDPEVYAALAPKAVHSFGVAENRALAQQQKDAKEYAINTNASRFKALSSEKATLMANQGGGNTEMKDNLQARVDEINAEQEDILTTLGLNEVNEAGLQKFRDADTTIVYSKMAQQHIERVFTTQSPADAYRAANEFVQKAMTDTGVDETIIKTLASQTITNLTAIQRAESTAEKQFRSEVYNDLYRGIVIDGLNILDVMQDPDSDFYELEGTQQATLFNISGQSESARKSSAQAANTQQYNDNMANINAPSVVSKQVHFESLGNIVEMYIAGTVNHDDYIKAVEAYDETKGVYHKGDRADIGATIQMELGPMSSYARPGVYYLGEDYVKNLERIGVIGDEEGSTYKSRSSYINAVEDYVAKRKEFVDLHKTAASAERRVTAGMKLSSTEEDALVKVKGFDKVRIVDQNGNKTFVDLDFFSEDQNVVQASIDAVASYAVMSQGQMHPAAKSVFEAALQSDEVADLAFRIMGQAVTAVKKLDPTYNDELAESTFLINSNISEEAMGFIRTAQVIGVENARKSVVLGKENANRNLNEFVNTNGFGTDADEWFDQTFQNSLEGYKFFTLLNPTVSPYDQQMLNQMASNAGVSNVEGAVLANPYLKQSIKDLFYGRMLKGHKNAKPETVMRDVIRQIGTRVGVELNPQTGGLEFVRNPILKQAQGTVPAVQFGAPGEAGRPVVQLEKADIDRAVVDMFLNSDTMLNPELIENLQNIGAGRLTAEGRTVLDGPSLHYSPNDYYGSGKQTYTVFMRDPYGKFVPLTTDFHYDFTKVEAYNSFKESAASLETERAKKIWSVWGLLDQSLVQTGFESIEANRHDESLLPLVNAYNKFAKTVGITPMSNAPLTKEEIVDFGRAMQKITSLGYR